MGIDDKTIEEIVRRILTVARLDKIIFFGSAATERMTRDSDIDLLIVEPNPSDGRNDYGRSSRRCGTLITHSAFSSSLRNGSKRARTLSAALPIRSTNTAR